MVLPGPGIAPIRDRTEIPGEFRIGIRTERAALTVAEVVSAELLVTGPRCLRDARVEFENGLITAVSGRETDMALTLSALTGHGEQHAPRILVPGFIDIQVNGLGPVDVPSLAASRHAEAWVELGRSLASGGVTSWLPTIVTRPLSDYGPMLETVSEVQGSSPGGPAILGVHLEGPFLGERPGAHPRDRIRDVDTGFLRDLPPVVRLVTLAPEAAGAAEGTAVLTGRGVVVSMGHTGASREQFDEVLSAGATMVTHLFNAMTGIHHRRGGVATWALTHDGVTVCLIGDGYHVSPDVIRLVRAVRPTGGLILVSDAVAHQRPGLLGGGDGQPVRMPDGTLAGSTVTMAGCLRTLMATGADLREAVRVTATEPARALGLSDRGRLLEGQRADMVLLDPALEVLRVWSQGRIIHG